MKRYGDNVTQEDIFDGPNKIGESSKLFLGGCAATYGAFPVAENRPKAVTQKGMFEKLLLLLRNNRKGKAESHS